MDLDERAWGDWVVARCAELGLDPGAVDIHEIHDLTREVAHRHARPLAPVAAYLLGMARGRDTAPDPLATLLASLPEEGS